MTPRSDADHIRNTHNTSRFFVEHHHIAWVLLIATVLWGWYGYHAMPQRKDPEIPVRVAVAVTPWPGVPAAEVEQQITRMVEEKIAESTAIHPATADAYGIRSISLQGLSIVYVQLAENVKDTRKEFSDINLRLNTLNSRLPSGAGPIQFQSDFGDTTALMLTVASPKIDATEIALRARSVRDEIAKIRGAAGPGGPERVAAVYSFPQSVAVTEVRRGLNHFVEAAERDGVFSEVRTFAASGFLGVDGVSTRTDDELRSYIASYLRDQIQASDLHPDAWGPAIIRDLADTESRLAAVAGDKYSYRELDEFSDLIARTLAGVPQASKYQRRGVLPEQIYLDFSQERLASYGVQPARLGGVLQAHNIAPAAGAIEAGGKLVYLNPTGEFTSAAAIGETIVGTAANGSPVYLRDLVEISRGYQSPARYLNTYTARDAEGHWQRSRAVTVAIFMRTGEQIAEFGREVDERLAALRHTLPPDLIIARTSDQPRQVRESIDLFMDALKEAIVLVVLVSLIGFWEWRSAVLMALSIPLTLAMTFGFAAILGIDLQQVSVASLILALGLLVDDPVVAGDAIKRSITDGHSNRVAAWLGPTKLAKAILFATITNIAAYLPFLMVTGSTGEFLYSLPIVMTCSLVASRIVSMTFIPLLGYYLLRPGRKPEPTIEERRQRGLTARYARLATWAIRHRWKVLLGSLPILLLGALAFANLKTLFFPNDVQYWATVDVRLPNDASVAATNAASRGAEAIIRKVAAEMYADHPHDAADASMLRSLTTFVGGGGPRFWFSIAPEIQQPNYAQIIVEIDDKELMPSFSGRLQNALSAGIPGAYVEVKQLQINPVEFPVEIMISSLADIGADGAAADMQTLRDIGARVEDILRGVPEAANVRTDWQPPSFGLELQIDSARANLAGITHADVAVSTATALNGQTVTVLREQDKQIPVVARLRPEERAQLADLRNLYIYSTQGPLKLPLAQVATLKESLQTQRIQRRDHFRTLTVLASPIPGALSSEVLNTAWPALQQLEKTLPPGYRLTIGGEQAKQVNGFRNLAVVMAISVAAIFLTLVLQFNHGLKPLLVYAAVPYGIVGAVAALAIMRTAFGFMALLGIASLIGVIVSHIIVLFDFIEEKHAEGEPLEQALVDAGIVRLRPVMITVGATVLALFPLALHGGPLWKPLCYAQIGGLTAATFITLLLVPVLYSIFVLDLKLIRWEDKPAGHAAPAGTHSGNC